MREWKLFAKDMLDATEAIEKFVLGLNEENFGKDDLVQSAVIRKFEVLGEAAKQIPSDVRLQHAEVPWNKVAGMRDQLIHGYYQVNSHRVWQTIQEDLPVLKSVLAKIVA